LLAEKPIQVTEFIDESKKNMKHVDEATLIRVAERRKVKEEIHDPLKIVQIHLRNA